MPNGVVHLRNRDIDADMEEIDAAVDNLPEDIHQIWTPTQYKIAHYVAKGYTKEQTGRMCNVHSDTVRRLLIRNDFNELVYQLAQEAMARIEPTIMANLELALDIQRNMFLGEIPATDRRYTEARALLSRFLDKLLYTEAAQPTSAVPTQQYINNALFTSNNGNAPADPADQQLEKMKSTVMERRAAIKRLRSTDEVEEDEYDREE